MAWHATGGLEGGDPTAAVGVELAAAFDQLYVGLVSVETAGFFPGASLRPHVTADHHHHSHNAKLTERYVED